MKKYLVFAMVLVLAVALVSPVSVSAKTKAGAKPGSFFYFFDKAIEKTSLFFTFNPEKKAKKVLEYAEERLAEAEELQKEKEEKETPEIEKDETKKVEISEKEVEKTDNKLEKEEIEETETKDDKKEETNKKDDQSQEFQLKKINQSSEIERLQKEIEDLKKNIQKQQTPPIPENNQPQSSNIAPFNTTSTASIMENPVLKIERCKIEAQSEIDKIRETIISVANLGYEKCVQNTSEYIQQQCPECRTPEMFQSIQSTCYNKTQDSLTTLKSEMYNREYLECLNR